jgi:hypothetical protein
MPRPMRAGRGAIWSVGRRSVVCMATFLFGVPQACDEISGDADRYVEELVRRRATPPGLASSSSR